MMKAVMSELKGYDTGLGCDLYWAFIVSESAPSGTSVSGSEVEGVPDSCKFAAGSVIVTPSGNYWAFNDNEFSKKTG